AKFKGFGDLSLIGLPLDSPEWNELKLDDIRLRVKAGRHGIKFDNLIWNGSLEQIEKYIVEVAYQKSIEQSSQGQTKKSGSRSATTVKKIEIRNKEDYEKRKDQTLKCGGCTGDIKHTNFAKNFQSHMRSANYKCYDAAIDEGNYSADDFLRVKKVTYNNTEQKWLTEEEFKTVCIEAQKATKQKSAKKRLEKKRKKEEAAAEKQGAEKKSKE
ncbi:hypothetical protein TrRE_jg1469, partial [Triparma retinervis]